ncbi:MAG: hypothetical protein LC099_05545 [Anaerolineales bacterium]|nr:hypothetical protein [Anaerolineales bacterium]
MTTHRERIQACFKGEQTDRVPVALWRHFPEEDQDPQTLAAATLQFQETYDFDIVKVSPSSAFMVKDWGVQDEWRNNPEGSRAYTKHVIEKPQDWETLTALDPSAPHLAAQLDCLRVIQRGLAPETPLIQTVFNPLSQAKNLAGADLLLEHLQKYPEALTKGLETIAKGTVKFIEALRELGVDGIFYAVQHAQNNLLSLEEYEKIALPYDLQTLVPAKEFWCNLLHLHGKDVHFSLANQMDFQIVNWHDRETFPSLSEAENLFDGALCGGVRQETLYAGDSDQVKKEARDAVAQTRGRRFILGTGCVVYYQSPRENIMAVIESAR